MTKHSWGSTSASLIAGLHGREPAAWRRLVDWYGPLVYHWCRRSGLAAEIAAEILQETLRSTWQRIDDFQPQPTGSFRGWLRTITTNKIRDHFRKAGRQPQATGGTTAQANLQEVPASEPDEDDASPWVVLVQQALAAVRPHFAEQTWQAFWLTTVDGLSAAEAGARLGLTANTVRQAKFKVLRRLRQELGDLN